MKLIIFLLIIGGILYYMGVDVPGVGSKYSYNVLFYPPNGNEQNLGNVDSISSCQSRAAREAARRDVSNIYVCCKTDGKSFCISKHK